MIEQLLNCLTMVSQSVQVNILNNSCLYGTVLRKIYCLYISHFSSDNNDRRAAKLSNNGVLVCASEYSQQALCGQYQLSVWYSAWYAKHIVCAYHMFSSDNNDRAAAKLSNNGVSVSTRVCASEYSQRAELHTCYWYFTVYTIFYCWHCRNK